MAEAAIENNEWNDLEIQTYFETVIARTEAFLDIGISDDDEYRSNVLSHVDLLERTATLPAQLSLVVEDETDLQLLECLRTVFVQVEVLLSHFGNSTSRQTRVSFLPYQIEKHEGPGRPPVFIPAEVLEDLREVGFTWDQIAKMFCVSRWTIMCRVQSLGLQSLTRFSDITDQQIDDITMNYITNHGRTTGESYLRGHFRSLGYNIPRRSVRASLNRVDPINSALRWGALVSRQVYSVPWPNSLWHLDGHHSLIHWGLVIHGCIDGYSRRIMFLLCSNNNEALKEWMCCHNDHPLATEHNWSPNQIWLNGMMNACNPLARGEADDDPDNITVYGDDPEFSPFDESENDVQVFPPNVPAINSDLLTRLQTNINPLQDSTSLGIDIYMRALEIVVEVLQNEAI